MMNRDGAMVSKSWHLAIFNAHSNLLSQITQIEIRLSTNLGNQTTRTFLKQTQPFRQASASPTHTDHLSRIPRSSPLPSVSTPYAPTSRLRDCWRSNFYNIQHERTPPTSHAPPPRSCPLCTETEAAAGRNTVRMMWQ